MKRKIQRDVITIEDLLIIAAGLPLDTPILRFDAFNGPRKSSEIEIDEFFRSKHVINEFEYTSNDSTRHGKGIPCIVIGE